MSSVNLKPIPIDQRLYWEEFFWDQVTKDLDSECWVWDGPYFPTGYGYHYIPAPIKGYFRAHRLAYALTQGDPTTDMLVCHECDNPSCVRPSHLFVGTNMTNTKDKLSKGRGNYETTRGTLNGQSKLTEDQVSEIFRLYQEGESQRSLASKFGVAKYSVQGIVHGRTWKHLNLGVSFEGDL
jgi:hypothetical protein